MATTSSIDISVNTQPEVYPLLDPGVKLNTGTYQQGSALTVGGITTPIDGPIPEVGQPFITNLSRDGDEASFTHNVDEVGRDGENQVQLVGYGLERNLHQTQITKSFDDATEGEVIRYAADQAGVPALGQAFPNPDNLAPEDATLLRAARQDEPGITADYNSVPAITVIDEAVRHASWEWRVTNGFLWYGEQAAAVGIEADDVGQGIEQGAEGIERQQAIDGAPTTHQLRWILTDDTNPRQQRYPFDLIQVVGQPYEYAPDGQIAITDPIVAEVEVGPEGESGYSGTPRVHKYVDERITTQGQANRTARVLWKELERQAKSGPIKTIGDPRPEPLDRVVMPDSLGGQNHLVKSVYHTITSDGFVTEISIQGQPNTEAIPEIRTTLSTDVVQVSGGQSSNSETGDGAETDDGTNSDSDDTETDSSGGGGGGSGQ